VFGVQFSVFAFQATPGRQGVRGWKLAAVVKMEPFKLVMIRLLAVGVNGLRENYEYKA